MKRILIIWLIMTLSGCGIYHIHKAQECATNILSKYKYNGIFDKYVNDLSKNTASLEQLSDNTFIKDDEIPIIKSIHNELMVCRKMVAMTPEERGFFSQLDALTADLIQKKITWGEYNRKRSEIYTKAATLSAALERQRNQSVTTNCYRIGNSMSCNSY